MSTADIIPIQSTYDPSVPLTGTYDPTVPITAAYLCAPLIRGSLSMIHFDPPGSRVLGKRWEFPLALTNAAGQKLDLTAATVTVALGASPGVRYASAVATLADQVEQTGVATAVFLPAVTADLPIPFGGQMFYQVDVSFDSNNVDTVAWGHLAVQKSLI